MSSEDRLAVLRAEIQTLREEAENIAAEYKGDDIPQEQLSRLEEIEQTIAYNGDQIDSLERIGRICAQGNKDDVVPQARGRVTQPNQPQFQRQAPKFNHFGEFTQAVSRSVAPGAQMDQRLARMAPSRAVVFVFQGGQA